MNDNKVLTMKVSLNEAKMWATPKTISPSLTAGPRVTFSSLGSLVFLLDWYIEEKTDDQQQIQQFSCKKKSQIH